MNIVHINNQISSGKRTRKVLALKTRAKNKMCVGQVAVFFGKIKSKIFKSKV